MFNSFTDSLSVSFCTGTPVQDATIWAMSSSSTTGVVVAEVVSDAAS